MIGDIHIRDKISKKGAVQRQTEFRVQKIR